MKEEYTSLRQEILEWQSRRFLLVAASITLVTGILGLGIDTLGKFWVIISSLLLLFLTCTTYLSWYAGRANAKISAYLVVFHEEMEKTENKGAGWESRLTKLKKQRWVDTFTLNHALTAIYATLGVVSLIVPWIAAGRPFPSGSQSIILLITAILLTSALVFQWLFSYPRGGYAKHWRAVKKDEKGNSRSSSKSTS